MRLPMSSITSRASSSLWSNVSVHTMRAERPRYRILLAELYAGKPVHAALLLADGRLVDMMSG